ncbi:MAG TPA: hypothetical protein VGO04_04600 [Ensifer sp.]|jgi:ABC-type multidrug transport system fused ATPase/permease subunit|uniref:hypothetical protein n=1 Tax=Ensifer sp. TaxID=1872086 RepID=UPI002E0ED652|nr:hypothetical protein [Ensifer sp.]
MSDAGELKGLLEKIAGLLPRYFLELGNLVSGPKEFVKSKDVYSDQAFESALVFAAITVLLLFITMLTIYGINNLIVFLILGYAASFISIGLISMSIMLAWRAVGWKRAAKPIFVVMLYYYAAINWMTIILTLTYLGFLKSYAPTYHSSVLKSIRENEFNQLGNKFSVLLETAPPWESNTFSLGSVVASLGIVFILIWIFIGWGAFRNLSGLQKWKSGVAFILFLLIFYLAGQVNSFILAAMYNKIE